MNAAQYAPLFGLLVGLVLMGWAALKKSRPARLSAYAAFFASWFATVIAYMAGAGGFGHHSAVATLALLLNSLAAGAAAVAFFAERAPRVRNAAQEVLFVLGVTALGAVGYASVF